ncbi:hypothetical protein BKA80DRAFT_281634, partial [Phyllosticta citrichinensis]
MTARSLAGGDGEIAAAMSTARIEGAGGTSKDCRAMGSTGMKLARWRGARTMARRGGQHHPRSKPQREKLRGTFVGR